MSGLNDFHVLMARSIPAAESSARGANGKPHRLRAFPTPTPRFKIDAYRHFSNCLPCSLHCVTTAPLDAPFAALDSPSSFPSGLARRPEYSGPVNCLSKLSLPLNYSTAVPPGA